MNDYARKAMLAVMAFSAVTAMLLEPMGRALAAMIGMAMGGLFADRFDEVSRRFRSDVDRILEPNEPTKAVIVRWFMFALLAAGAFALATRSAAVGSMMGWAALYLIIHRSEK